MMQSSRISTRKLATFARSNWNRTVARNSCHNLPSGHAIHAAFRPHQHKLLLTRRTWPISPSKPATRVSLKRTKTTVAKPKNHSSSDYVSAESGPFGRWVLSMRRFLGKSRIIPIPRWISPQYSTTTISEVFGHASFLLVAMSYAVEDFIHLRLIAIAGSSAMLVFTYFHPHGRILWLPFKWNLAFMLINGYRVMKVYTDRFFAGRMDELMLYMHDHHFYVMDMVDFAALVKLGTRQNYQKGEVVVQQGEDNRFVRLVLQGELNVTRDGVTTYEMHQGNFISEAGLHAGLLLRGNVNSCCSVIAKSDDVQVMRWDRTELMYLMEVNKNVQRSLKAVMSWDIVSKLKSQRSLLANGKVKDPEEWTNKRRQQTLHRYKGILKNVLAHPAYLNKRKEELVKYRDIHHIEQEEHEQALTEMGWTLAEFDAGKKNGHMIDEDLVEPHPHSWKAYFYQKYQWLVEQ